MLTGEAADRGVLIGIDIEDLIKPGELHHVLNPGREFHEFQLDTLSRCTGAGGHQFAQAAAVDVINLGHVQQDFRPPRNDGFLDQLPELLCRLAESNGTLQMQDENIAHLPVEVLQRHAAKLSRTSPAVNRRRFDRKRSHVTWPFQSLPNLK